MPTKLKVILIAAICAALSQPLYADDAKAREIMKKVEDRDDGDNMRSDMTMVLIDKNGKQRVRSLRSFRKDKGKDTQSLMFFLSPADVTNTGFLTYDYDDPNKDDDQWLYLPALKKTKRIAAGDKSGSFMGSDLNYSDMTSRDIDDYDYTLKKEMKVRDQDVWVIESVPRSKETIEETGYEKALVFVRKDNYVVVRAISWVESSNKLKYMDIPKLEKIDGIWTPRELTMTTKRGKQTEHQTVLKFDNVRFNQKLDESMFTTRRLEKGL
ncbi:MAG: outer membrane lipoprotein-sorting protein [Gammaproteobacteria bacterium]|nr:outer membrane lipoprotein-sorting protein [Gammaproteobacteria bacterium]